MVATHDVVPLRRLEPIWPDLDQVAPEDWTTEYDRVADTLVVGFGERNQPTVGVVFGDYELLRVDPVTGKVVGVELERFLRSAIYVHPEFLDVLQDVVEITPREIATIWRNLDRKHGRRGGTTGSAATRRLIVSIRDRMASGGRLNGRGQAAISSSS